jgi:sulfur-oxidizing protein SoxY
VTPSATSGAWQALARDFYGRQAIGEVDEKLMSPRPRRRARPIRRHAVVTIRFGHAAAGKVKQVRLIIDHNPSPRAATMQLEQGVPIDEIELRIASTAPRPCARSRSSDDGSLEMRSRLGQRQRRLFVAAGRGGAGALGDIRFRAGADGKALQVSLRHPNNSGFQIDPVSGDADSAALCPAHAPALRRKTLFDADTGISLAENPTVRIASEQSLSAPLTLERSIRRTSTTRRHGPAQRRRSPVADSPRTGWRQYALPSREGWVGWC